MEEILPMAGPVFRGGPFKAIGLVPLHGLQSKVYIQGPDNETRQPSIFYERIYLP